MKNYLKILKICSKYNAKLIVVSKNQTNDKILKLFDAGQREFAENKIQAISPRVEILPTNINWHMIGHLQTNKIRNLVQNCKMLQSLDSIKLANELNSYLQKKDLVLDILIQIKISSDVNKSGFEINELENFLNSERWKNLENLNICGLMGIASIDGNKTREEFKYLSNYYQMLKKSLFLNNQNFKYLSMGMSSDYHIALDEGANMLRIGSLIFDDIE